MSRKYQVRVRISAIRTFTVQAKTQKQAGEMAIQYMQKCITDLSGGKLVLLPKDKMRVTSIAELIDEAPATK